MTLSVDRTAAALEGARVTGGGGTVTDWWRTAVIYQVYPRSFADSDGDGIGDIAGVRRHLGYLAELGVDAIWFTPWYRSPLADGGYDVADYRDIHPDLGDLAQAEAVIAEAAELGIRTIVDIVPNHVSDQHEWFRAALAAGPGSPERARFWFRDGRGPGGDEPPNTWPSSFSGDTWTRTTDPDGTPGQWYLHLFTPQQPDLNWTNPDVQREHAEILRFWFDRGVGGVRVDSAALVAKDPELPEIVGEYPPGHHPNLDRDELHEIYRQWRTIADGYPGSRVLVGELWLPDLDRFALYLRPDEIHLAFNFDFMTRPWRVDELRASITATVSSHAGVNAPPTWVLSNHDVTRPVTRYGRVESGFSFDAKRFGTVTDLDLGRRRARAAALLTAALPGAMYIYQGDELGLPEVEDIPADRLEDPMHFRSDGVDPGRDGCRVPLPWSGSRPPFGFSPTVNGTDTWLPQPADWSALTVQAQLADDGSMLSLYRRLLAVRRSSAALSVGSFEWLPASGEVLAFRRSADAAADEIQCFVNLSTEPIPLPPGAVVVSSDELDAGRLPPDTAAWIIPSSPEHHQPR